MLEYELAIAEAHHGGQRRLPKLTTGIREFPARG